MLSKHAYLTWILSTAPALELVMPMHYPQLQTRKKQNSSVAEALDVFVKCCQEKRLV